MVDPPVPTRIVRHAVHGGGYTTPPEDVLGAGLHPADDQVGDLPASGGGAVVASAQSASAPVGDLVSTPVPVAVSVVVPAYNEEDNIPLLVQELRAALDPLGLVWECIFVDDGSQDTTLEVLKALAREQPGCLRYLSFQRNCGQSAAFAAGFQAARGAVIVTLDADLQNDPADIPAMLQVYQGQGCDMVIGWRAKRKDTAAKRLASRFANAVRNYVSRETVRDTGCSLKVLRADLAKRLPMFTGMHRFLPTLMKLEGARVEEIPVNHRPRCHGKSKYGIFDRALRTWSDLLAVRWMQMRYIRYHIKEQG